MYKIIGADGKEYSPVSIEQLRQWIVEGRVNTQTRVQLAGTMEWKALGDLPEFAVPPLLVPPPLKFPPPIPAPSGTSGVPV